MNFHRPLLMGVLNVTPDSFSDGGLFERLEVALAHAREMLEQGADIIDIGGESTRPGAKAITPDEEQARVIPVIEALGELRAGGESPRQFRISIDTVNAQTAELAIAAGADIVNDISGGLRDPRIFEVVAGRGVDYVLGHWRGPSERMDEFANYQEVAAEVARELQARVEAALAAGMPRERIVLDPGFGFSKNMAQNWQLAAGLSAVEALGYPVMVGVSRKRFLAKTIADLEEAQAVDNRRRDVATAVLTALLLQHRLWAVRVHDVQSSADAISLVAALRSAEGESSGRVAKVKGSGRASERGAEA